MLELLNGGAIGGLQNHLQREDLLHRAVHHPDLPHANPEPQNGSIQTRLKRQTGLLAFVTVQQPSADSGYTLGDDRCAVRWRWQGESHLLASGAFSRSSFPAGHIGNSLLRFLEEVHGCGLAVTSALCAEPAIDETRLSVGVSDRHCRCLEPGTQLTGLSRHRRGLCRQTTLCTGETL